MKKALHFTAASRRLASYEWAGIFATPDDSYTWIAQKVNGDYADPTMKLVAVSASAATGFELGYRSGDAEASFAETCTEVPIISVMLSVVCIERVSVRTGEIGTLWDRITY